MTDSGKLLSDFQGEITQLLIIDPELKFPTIIGEGVGWRVDEMLKPFTSGKKKRANRLHAIILMRKAKDNEDDFRNKRRDELLEKYGGIESGIDLTPIEVDECSWVKAFNQVRIGRQQITVGSEIRFGTMVSFAKYIRDFLLVKVGERGESILLQHKIKKLDAAVRVDNPEGGVLDPIFNTLVGQHNFCKSTTSLFLAGGDVLSGPGFALVGFETINANLSNFNGDIDRTTDELATVLGVKEVYYPHHSLEHDLSSTQPPDNLYHLDVFVTLLAPKKDKIQVAVGQVFDLIGNCWELAHEDDPEQKYLNGFEASLRKIGGNNSLFEVYRLPLHRKQGVLYSHGNCLVETSPSGVKSVITPFFHSGYKGQSPLEGIFKEADDRACIAFSEMGYQMIGVKGTFQDDADAKAGLRCLTQVLRRTTY